MADVPRVTVIMATYNWSTVLPYSIASVQDQTVTDWELLVVGDECTDDSAEVVARIDDPRVRFINLRPGTRHQFGPNNEGLRRAAGSVIAYLGHDDLWLPRHLELALGAIDGGADLTHTIALQVVPDGSFQAPLLETRRGWIPPSVVVHRKAVTDAIGGWRDFRTLAIGPEQDLWERMAAAGYRKTFVPRLGAVKFPASWRPNAYLDRPSHEQAAWLRRIQDEPDFEATELGRAVAGLTELTHGTRQRRQTWRLLTEPSQWAAFIWRRNGARIRARQTYKGATAARVRDGGSEVGRSEEGLPGRHA
jgi:glycosyltransferase involved in cell wall biosynthesis